jgi:pantetheine-phosphate adenylyltransferase
MTVRAFLPGTFDPIHNGHIDIATRAARLMRSSSVYDRPLKSLCFRQTRMNLRSPSAIPRSVVGFWPDGRVCRSIGAVIVRGLCVFPTSSTNFAWPGQSPPAPEIEHVALITNGEHSFILYHCTQIAPLGGDVSSMVPAHVGAALETRFTN